MNKNINFLREKAVLIKKRRRKNFLINFISFVVLIAYGLGLVSLFSFYFIQKKENNVLKQKVKNKEEEIKGFEPVETKQVYLKSKLNSLINILSSRRENQRIAEAIFNLLPEGIAIDGFAIDEKGGVSFSATSKKLSVLKSFLSSLEQQPTIEGLKISTARIEGISFNYKTGYSLKVYLLFNG